MADRCQECGSRYFYTDYRRAETVCKTCGSVLVEKIIQEGRGTTTEDFRKNENDVRLKPQLIYSGRDSKGKPVANDILWKIRHTSKIYNLDPRERSANKFEDRIRRLAAQRGLPENVTKRAVEVYYRVFAARLFKKPNLGNFALALLMAACRELRHVVTFEDLIDDSKTPIRKINTPFKAILRFLGHNDVMPFDHKDFIVYFAGKLRGVAETVVSDAKTVAALSTLTDSSAAPHVIAAAALYISLRNSGSMLSQRAYCARVNLSEISLREWVNRLGGYKESRYTSPEIDPGGLDEGP